jgi:hypothetical protein
MLMETHDLHFYIVSGFLQYFFLKWQSLTLLPDNDFVFLGTEMKEF